MSDGAFSDDFSPFSSQALKHAQFFADNQDLYGEANTIKRMDFPLSSSIADILEGYYGAYGG